MGMSTAAFEPARLELARLRINSPSAYDQAVRRATELTAKTLGVERVGVWLFEPDSPERLALKHLFVLSTGQHTEGDQISIAQAPAYRAALHERKVIIAHDALADPVTSQLEQYLKRHQITSMLDAPLYLRGEVVGVICLEHIGPKREWSSAEVDFACTIADSASLICEQAHRIEMEASFRDRAARISETGRMDALAQVCAGISHELANVFAVVGVVGDGLARLTDESARAFAPPLQEALEIARRMLTGLQRFGAPRGRGAERRRSSSGAVLQRLVPILALLTRPQQLVVSEGPSLRLAIDDGALEHVLLNLTLNAREALQGAGRLGTIRIGVTQNGEGARLEVADDGPGMSPEVLERAKEPYFTTKSTGTGLGLAVVQSLVDEAGGRLSFSTSAEGTVARVDLDLEP